MPDIFPPQRITARQRLVELTQATAIPMPDGPKWVCQLLPGQPGIFDHQPADQRPSVHELLQQLKPLNLELEQGHSTAAGWMLNAPSSEACFSRAYVLLRTDCSLEIVGVLPTGLWPPYQCTWWPGAYEIPLLKQIGLVFQPLIAALKWPTPVFLHMGLINLQDSALIAHERAYPIPAEHHMLALPPVCFAGDTEQIKSELVQAFNCVRACAGVAMTHAFYL
ncbi:hypothetical protein VI06_10965 [Aquitalea magnusonii]|nr:hypothetical protein VI06_10965 [Aquitalea magnusonii]